MDEQGGLKIEECGQSCESRETGCVQSEGNVLQDQCESRADNKGHRKPRRELDMCEEMFLSMDRRGHIVL